MRFFVEALVADVIPVSETSNNIVQSSTLSVLLFFGWELIGMLGRIIYHACKDYAAR